MHPAEEAAGKFITYIQQHHISRPFLDGSLIGHIGDWLDKGGFEAVKYDFDLYVKTVTIIIDEWHKDPALLDYRKTRSDGRQHTRKRRPDSIFKDADDRSRLLNRTYFDYVLAAYQRKNKC